MAARARPPRPAIAPGRRRTTRCCSKSRRNRIPNARSCSRRRSIWDPDFVLFVGCFTRFFHCVPGGLTGRRLLSSVPPTGGTRGPQRFLQAFARDDQGGCHGARKGASTTGLVPEGGVDSRVVAGVRGGPDCTVRP